MERVMRDLKLSQYNLEVPAAAGVFWYNTLTGRSVLLSEERLLLLKQLVPQLPRTAPETPAWSAVTEFLTEHGFAVPAEQDEVALAMQHYDQTVGADATLSLVIAPSLQCNMSCYYCYEGGKPTTALGLPDADALLSFIASRLTADGGLGITWFGGEPLLSKPFVVEVSRRLQALCGQLNVTYAFRMVSNGYLLDAPTAAELAQHGIGTVQVTFDGSRPLHDRVRRSSLGAVPSEPSFDRIIENIRAASEHLRILIRINVSRINLASMPLLVEQLAAAGLASRVAGIYFYPVFHFDPADEAAAYLPQSGVHLTVEQFAVEERRLVELLLAQGFSPFTPQFFTTGYLGCYAAIDNGFVVDYQGHLKKCDHELGVEAETASSIYDFAHLDSDESLLQWRSRRPDDNPSCRACVFLPICYAHCPHSNLLLPDQAPRCPSYKHNWRELFPIYLEQRLSADPSTVEH